MQPAKWHIVPASALVAVALGLEWLRTQAVPIDWRGGLGLAVGAVGFVLLAYAKSVADAPADGSAK